MDGSWGSDSAQPGASVDLSGSYDAHDAGVSLKVEIYNAADVTGDKPSDGASPVAAVSADESADRTCCPCRNS